LPVDPIVSVDVFPVRLPTRATLHLARGPVSDEDGAPHVFVRARDAAGIEGWGEARPSHRWSDETEETVVSTIRRYLGPAVVGRNPSDLAGLHLAMDRVIAPGLTRGQPIAKSAVDLAVHDLLGRRLDLSLPSLFGRSGVDRLPLCWTVSADNPVDAEAIAREGQAAGYRGFKVKLGVRPENDPEIVAAVRAIDRSAYLWVDANQSYDVGAARRLARILAPLGIDVFEQPTPARDVDALRRLRADGCVPIAVDESIFSAQDLLRLLRLEAFDVLVVKVCKFGGLWPARRCLDIAEEAGIPVLASSLTESGLGVAASGALFGAYRLAGPADLNGPQMLQAAPGVPAWSVDNGALIVPPGPGIGVTPDLTRLSSPGRPHSPNRLEETAQRDFRI
jgi:muconate cycloisomerase